MAGVLRRIVPRAIRRSYALKFAIVLLVLGVAVGAIGVVATDQVQTEVESIVHDDHAEAAVQQAQAIENWNSNNEDSVEAMARSSAIESGDEEAIRSYLEDEITERHGLTQVGQTNPQLHYINVETGEVEASTKGDPGTGESVTSLEGAWFEDLDDVDETETTDAYRSDIPGGAELRVGYVTEEGALQDGYVLAYTVPVSDYNMDAGGGAATIVDENETILFASPSSLREEAYDEELTPLYEAQEREGRSAAATDVDEANGVLTSSSSTQIGEGDSYVVGTAPVGGTDWVAMTHTSSDNAYGFVQDIQQDGIYATLGIVLLVVVIGATLGFNTSRSIDRLTGKAEQMEAGDLDVDLDSPRIDSIGQLYDGFDNMRGSLKTRITEAQGAREEAERARAETQAINTHLETKADEYREVMQVCAGGDLTARMETESENEAMAAIAEEFNEMVAELEATTGHVKRFAGEVATASEQVTASSEEVRSASEQVTESVQEISDGAERQNESLQAINHEMSGLSTTTEEIAASSNQVADIAEQTAQTGKQGREAAQDAIEGMNEIEDESAAAVADIEALEAEMEQIDELIEFIGEVAKETNMLALNANIEASRSNAGDDGFSVVAGEVKDLAEETKAAAEDIEQRLEAIQTRTAETASSVTATSERVESNREAIEAAVAALDEIADYAEETNVGVQEISAATEEQAASTQEVVAMADEAATISEETTAESENVAAAAEEQTTALTEVSQSASDLANQAAQLSETLDRFDTADVNPAAALEDEQLSFEEPGEDLGSDEASSDEADTAQDETGAAPEAAVVDGEQALEGADESAGEVAIDDVEPSADAESQAMTDEDTDSAVVIDKDDDANATDEGREDTTVDDVFSFGEDT